MMANNIIDNPGMSIIVLSLTMNFLVLPLYRRADAMQEEERDMEAKLHDGVAHIKKTFKGDEKMMILQTFYRQNNYKPTYVFKSSISLFLEIPFFIAAYQFLSHLKLLQGVKFGVIADLGAADALIAIGNFHINLLPIIMTAVNLVSCVIFTKGYPMKTKVQLYSMPIFFFIFLYSSPAGLVFYWTLNNIFSLVKTILYKLKNPKKILHIMFAFAGAALVICAVRFLNTGDLLRFIWGTGIGVAFMIPLIISVIKKYSKMELKTLNIESNRKVYFAGAIFMVILIGCMIPSAVIKASPQEFVDLYYYVNPLWYISSALCFSIGTFLVWMGVFYWLTSKKYRAYFEIAVWIICGIMTLNYMFFGKNLGILSNSLNYENGMSFDGLQKIQNLAVIIGVAIIMFVIYRFSRKIVPQVLIICAIALGVMSFYNVVKINESVSEIKDGVTQAKEDVPSFSLSKSGKNVVVLMMDRGMNEYIPYLFNEKPKLKEMFSGFTYYPNTLSFGGFTNFGTPALFGGYEYTPMEINKRDTETLVSKQNEALKVMPVLFDKNDYNVTVCDPTYANYQWLPDLSIYNEYPDIQKYITSGKFASKESKVIKSVNNKRNFFCYSIMKTAPLVVQAVLYDDGNYHHKGATDGQTLVNNFVAEGTHPGFMNAYSTLENLSSMTEIKDDNTNTFLMMTNDTTHEPMLLQEPDYVPAEHVDNTAYETENANRYTIDGKTLKMETSQHYIHYQTNMASMLKIGEWMDYLKKNNVYDNTRIIIVADHGRYLQQMDDMILDDGKNTLYDAELYNPLLLVKDFNSNKFSTSEEFMTNGDVPTLAMKDLIKNPKNPFTGKEINNNEKYDHHQYVLGSMKWDIQENNGNVFLPGTWFKVHGDVRNKNNWSVLNENATFPTQK
jgi:YidC/Oxa1 family membrane protein insertase